MRPSRFECQPYWLSLITPHSAFVYGGNESLTKRGVPLGRRGGGRYRCSSGGMISRRARRDEPFLVNRFTERKRTPGSKHVSGVWEGFILSFASFSDAESSASQEKENIYVPTIGKDSERYLE